MSTNSILSGIAKDCSNMNASIGADKDLILINYFDFNKPATLSALNRQLNDDFNNKGGLTDIILLEGAKKYVFEGTDYSVVPSVNSEIKEDGSTWYSHSISFMVYNKSSEARETLLSLSKARVIAVTRDRSTGLFELFGAEQGLKLSGLERPYTGSQSSNFYSITIATPDIAVVKEKSIGELSLKLDGEGGSGGVIPPNDNLEYLLSLKEDKVNKGVPNGYAPLDGNAKVPAQFLNIVNNLTTGGATNILSAEQGKLINDRIEFGLNNIKTERIITLEAPVTRLKASEAINNLPQFEVEDNEIPYFVTTTTEGEQGYRVELYGLGKGTYGQGGTAISSFNVRIYTLVDSGLAGINEILFLGNTARDKKLFFKHENLESTYTSLETGIIDIVNGGRNVRFTENGIQFRDSGRFGQSSLLPPTGAVQQVTSNTLPNKSGYLTVSVNGVFADANGNINIAGGGAVPTWQQTIDQGGSNGGVVHVPILVMKTTNENARMQLMEGGQYGFTIDTPDGILLQRTGDKGRFEMSDSNITLDGFDKGVYIQNNGANTLSMSSGGNGAVELTSTDGVYLQGRAKGIKIDGQGGRTLITGSQSDIETSTLNVSSIHNSLNQLNIKNSDGIRFFNQEDFTQNIASLTTETFQENGFTVKALRNSGNFRNVQNFYTPNVTFEATSNGTVLHRALMTASAMTNDYTINLPTGSKGQFTMISNVNGVFADADGTVTLDLSGEAHTIDEVLEKGSIATDKTQTFKATGVTSETVLSNNGINVIDGVKSFVVGSEKASFLNETSHFMGELGTSGIVLNQNPLNPNFKTTLVADKNVDSDKLISLPNANGTLIMTINGQSADENGNIVVSGGGSQNLQQTIDNGGYAESTGNENSYVDLFDGGSNNITLQSTNSPITTVSKIALEPNQALISVYDYDANISSQFEISDGKAMLLQRLGDNFTSLQFENPIAPNGAYVNIPAKPSRFESDGTTPKPYTLATTEDVSTVDLQQVLLNGHISDQSILINDETGNFYTEITYEGISGVFPYTSMTTLYNLNGNYLQLSISESGVNNSAVFQGNSLMYEQFKNSTATRVIIKPNEDIDGNYNLLIPNKSGTLAINEDVILKQSSSEKNQANGYAGLDSTGKLFVNQLPAIAITDTFVVSSQAQMLALTAETGDVAVRTDLNKSFILKGTNPATLGDWQELLNPTSPVQSVFGRAGAVTANAGDYTTALVTETTNKNYQTDNQKLFNDATSSIQTQLDGKQPLLTNPITGTGTANFLSKFTSSGVIANSMLSDDSTKVMLKSIYGATSINSVFETYDSSGGDRIKMLSNGVQSWRVNGGAGEVGTISFSSPTNVPGLIFLNTNNTNRADVRLHAQTGGLGFVASTISSATGTPQMLLNTTGNLLIGTVTDDAVNKLQVNGGFKAFTGTSGITLDVNNQVNGSITFANGGSASPVPTIAGKSVTNAGIQLVASTSDTNASPDFILNARTNSGTDFTTLTNTAFRFSRFATPLVDILRNGNVLIGTTTDNGSKLQVNGSITSVTAPVGTNTTQVATTAFVLANSTNIPHLEFNNTDKTVWNNGKSNNSGDTAFGEGVLKSNTVNTNSYNSGFGSFTLQALTTGVLNTGVGYNAVNLLTTAGENTGIGANALRDSNAYSNTGIGSSAGRQTTSGSGNTYIGAQAMANQTTGGVNVAIGNNAGNYITGGTTVNAIANSSIFIGANTKALANNQTNQIVIGDSAVGRGSNTTVIGNSQTTDTYIAGRINGVKTYACKTTFTGSPSTGELVNTTGQTITWTNPSTGIYVATASSNIFDIGKTQVFFSVNQSNSLHNTTYTISPTTITFNCYGFSSGALMNSNNSVDIKLEIYP